MRVQIEERLRQLKAEFEEGQRALAELEAQEASLRGTLLRISGAMQVLGELLDSPQTQAQSAPASLVGDPLPMPEPVGASNGVEK